MLCKKTTIPTGRSPSILTQIPFKGGILELYCMEKINKIGNVISEEHFCFQFQYENHNIPQNTGLVSV
ncbi:hypothetical protein LEP1GSC055_0114 [Leptospira borgpetersenii str. Brem 307]|nr:hypothetical protein LEP1GSC055_0114 [Leptospira borgpetersenii str. Brem 307]